MALQRIVTLIDDETLEALQRKCKAVALPLSSYVRMLLVQHVQGVTTQLPLDANSAPADDLAGAFTDLDDYNPVTTE